MCRESHTIAPSGKYRVMGIDNERIDYYMEDYASLAQACARADVLNGKRVNACADAFYVNDDRGDMVYEGARYEIEFAEYD